MAHPMSARYVGNSIRRFNRRGTATVESALVFPLLIAVFLGMTEMGRGIMVLHTLQEASQAGCRVYSVEGATKQQASDIIDACMSNAGIANYDVEFHPTEKASVNTPMEPVTVVVKTSYENVAWIAPAFLQGRNLEGKCVLPADVDVSDGGDQNGYANADDDNPDDGVERVDDAPASS